MGESFHTGFGIPILQKTYNFYRELHGIISTFPKHERYSLGLRMENETVDLLKKILIAGSHSTMQKLTALQSASVILDFLKLLVRLAKDTKAINIKTYLRLEEVLVEIGKMLGGWIKATKQASQLS